MKIKIDGFLLIISKTFLTLIMYFFPGGERGGGNLSP